MCKWHVWITGYLPALFVLKFFELCYCISTCTCYYNVIFRCHLQRVFLMYNIKEFFQFFSIVEVSTGGIYVICNGCDPPVSVSYCIWLLTWNFFVAMNFTNLKSWERKELSFMFYVMKLLFSNTWTPVYVVKINYNVLVENRCVVMLLRKLCDKTCTCEIICNYYCQSDIQAIVKL